MRIFQGLETTFTVFLTQNRYDLSPPTLTFMKITLSWTLCRIGACKEQGRSTAGAGQKQELGRSRERERGRGRHDDDDNDDNNDDDDEDHHYQIPLSTLKYS